MQYKLHLNLRQRAALRTAISFWERKEVKDKAASFFGTCDKLKTREVRKKWGELTKTVVDEWNKNVLPKKLENELIHIVKMIGETIFNWHQYIKHEYKLKKEAINCIDEIKWTPYGTVDVVEIFKSSWLNNPNLNIIEVYNFACRYAIDDHINELWPKLLNEVSHNRLGDMFMHFDQHILAYWSCYRDGDLLNLIRYFELIASDLDRHERIIFNLIYDLSLSADENMLRLSVHQGYFIAMKYFWEKLTEEERDKSVLKCARIAVMRYNYYEYKDDGIKDYKRSQYVEICLFLLNQMSRGHKKTFFNERLELNDSNHFDKEDVKDDILKMMLSTWPWQELFMPVLKDMIQCQDHDSKMVCSFLNAITGKIYEDCWLGYSLESNKYRYLLREAWLIIPAFIKQNIHYCGMCDFMDDLMSVWDLDSLKLILNDPEIGDTKNAFINSGAYSYDQLIVNDKYEDLEQFIKEILRSDEEIRRFKQSIDPWYHFIIWDQFHLADKLLDWQSNTPEERQVLKNKIDAEEFCQELIEFCDYKLADKFLDWKFDTEEQKRNCKNFFKNDVFSIDHLCKIWAESKKNINKAKDKCLEFLQWFLESEKEIALFKKEKIVEFMMNNLIMLYLVGFKRDGRLDDFLSWCLLDDEEVRRLKQAVFQPNQRL